MTLKTRVQQLEIRSSQGDGENEITIFVTNAPRPGGKGNIAWFEGFPNETLCGREGETLKDFGERCEAHIAVLKANQKSIEQKET
ncbi:hypothetical protein [Maritimibacter sp. UBA3975]|uniref:hypothetical protein n=1 Tax=Maritimibacter sp. UBA3975 TaxID=1946833 RepID=UPI000C0B8248|nr:hypothetical protein [Maritimibacter sp. UBA3975]MAM63860.1 hypothetical protein [Maritimibacter sp.]|tara:strand:- start:72702 stop:72956 length:255 start_codon:yes stop_codon:yes gene_type:complete